MRAGVGEGRQARAGFARRLAQVVINPADVLGIPQTGATPSAADAAALATALGNPDAANATAQAEADRARAIRLQLASQSSPAVTANAMKHFDVTQLFYSNARAAAPALAVASGAGAAGAAGAAAAPAPEAPGAKDIIALLGGGIKETPGVAQTAPADQDFSWLNPAPAAHLPQNARRSAAALPTAAAAPSAAADTASAAGGTDAAASAGATGSSSSVGTARDAAGTGGTASAGGGTTEAAVRTVNDASGARTAQMGAGTMSGGGKPLGDAGSTGVTVGDGSAAGAGEKAGGSVGGGASGSGAATTTSGRGRMSVSRNAADAANVRSFVDAAGLLGTPQQGRRLRQIPAGGSGAGSAAPVLGSVTSAADGGAQGADAPVLGSVQSASAAAAGSRSVAQGADAPVLGTVPASASSADSVRINTAQPARGDAAAAVGGAAAAPPDLSFLQVQHSSLPSAAADPLSALIGVARATAASAAAAAAAASAPAALAAAQAPAPSVAEAAVALAGDATHVVRSAGAFAHEAAGSLHAGQVPVEPLGGFLLQVATSGISVAIANTITNPIDVVKVRMQLLRLEPAANGHLAAPNLVRTGVMMVQSEGASALMSGVSATVARGIFYGGLRLGMYGPLKTAVGADADPTLAKKILAGSLSGGIATLITNPMELIKTRLQSNSGQGGAVAVVRSVLAKDGVTGLWKGTMPSAIRGTLLTASQCATYDDTKRAWMRYTGWQDGLATHVGVSMITGLAATTITAPVDVVKTHMYCAGSRYTNPLHCATDIARREGLRGFFKGWTANYARLGPQTTIMFVVMEKMRYLAGMSGL
ncbi:hypothetical protein WJX81_001343 [Elliptochloris bilobata]|uniref:Uncharacterized protein n=1 Tax=Elliptochloris bilobata TaxID=381761 RepID=A0AAW1QWG5_9CHLO